MSTASCNHCNTYVPELYWITVRTSAEKIPHSDGQNHGFLSADINPVTIHFMSVPVWNSRATQKTRNRWYLRGSSSLSTNQPPCLGDS